MVRIQYLCITTSAVCGGSRGSNIYWSATNSQALQQNDEESKEKLDESKDDMIK